MEERGRNRKTSKTELVLFWTSVLTLVYFAFLYVNDKFFKIDLVMIGVIQEAITIPLIFVVIGLLIFSVLKIVKSNYLNLKYLIWTSLISLLLFSWIIWSFLNL
jgi:hypothetical protein